MRPALLILLAATAMTSASASTPTPAALKLAPGAAMSPLAQQGGTASLTASAQPQAMHALQTVALASPKAEASPDSQAADSTRRDALAPVAITLALIVAIAVRRRQTGKP